MTFCIQIGNTDNKLTQQEWNHFVVDVQSLVETLGVVHFFGGPATYAAWQNVCWVVEIKSRDAKHMLVENLMRIRANFKQESVAVLFGTTEFI